MGKRRRSHRVYDDEQMDRMRAIDELHAVQYEELTPDERAIYNYRGARRLAIAVLTSAWADAGKRPSRTKDNATQAPGIVVRYAQAWLQTPDATAKWCEIIDIDPELVASLSRRRHGRPKITPKEMREHEKDRRRH